MGINTNCRGRGKIETSTVLKTFINLFGLQGINIQSIHGDNEFDKIKALIAPIPVIACGRDEHIPDIERAIWTIKECIRCSTCDLPYKRIPGIMIDNNIEENSCCLNNFAPKDYISDTISPAGMILGRDKVDFNNLKLDFGQYCEIHDGTDNTQKPHIIRAIALRPKDNSGSYYFMSLETGKRVHSNNWVELSITDNVIARAKALAAHDGMDDLIDGELIFEWNPSEPILDLPPDYTHDNSGPGLFVE